MSNAQGLAGGAGGGWLTDTYREARIGESLFTLFASLTYVYHYLMTLIK